MPLDKRTYMREYMRRRRKSPLAALGYIPPTDSEMRAKAVIDFFRRETVYFNNMTWRGRRNAVR